MKLKKESFLGRATSARFLQLSRARSIRFQFGHLREAAADTVQQIFVKWSLGRGERIVAPLARFAHDDQTRPTQIREVSRHGWLSDSQDCHEISHAMLPIPEQVENSQASAV